MEKASSESIFNLNEKWTTQDEKVILLSELKGHSSIVAMTYTSCEHSCPLIIEDMKRIEKSLAPKLKDSTQFYLFSLDVERDLPQKLKAYSLKRKLDPTHWTLLHGDSRRVRELAAALGVRFKKEPGGDFDHSNIITLLNSEGTIEFQQIGLNQDPRELLEKAARSLH